MARSNDGTSSRYINVGDPVGGKFQREDAWTNIVFFNIASSATDDNAFCAMWESGVPQYLFRTDAQAAPTNIEVMGGGTSAIINGASSIALNTWYCAAVICDGSETTNDITLYSFDMTGSAIDDGVTGTHNGNDPVTTTDVWLMAREATADNIDGSLAHAAYFTEAFTRQDVLNYLYSPTKVVAQKTTCLWYFPLGLGSPEPDYSGNGESGTITGTLSIADNPPTNPWYPLDLSYTPYVVDAGGGGGAVAGLPLLGVG